MRVFSLILVLWFFEKDVWAENLHIKEVSFESGVAFVGASQYSSSPISDFISEPDVGIGLQISTPILISGNEKVELVLGAFQNKYELTMGGEKLGKIVNNVFSSGVRYLSGIFYLGTGGYVFVLGQDKFFDEQLKVKGDNSFGLYYEMGSVVSLSEKWFIDFCFRQYFGESEEYIETSNGGVLVNKFFLKDPLVAQLSLGRKF